MVRLIISVLKIYRLIIFYISLNYIGKGIHNTVYSIDNNINNINMLYVLHYLKNIFRGNITISIETTNSS